MTNINHSINYIEFPLTKNADTKQFYSKVFGWTFTDWGPAYLSFSGANVEGGFNGIDKAKPGKPGVLVVLYATDLVKTRDSVASAGGKILQDIYQFPGGKRFHFEDPNGNELAVWSEN